MRTVLGLFPAPTQLPRRETGLTTNLQPLRRSSNRAISDSIPVPGERFDYQAADRPKIRGEANVWHFCLKPDIQRQLGPARTMDEEKMSGRMELDCR